MHLMYAVGVSERWKPERLRTYADAARLPLRLAEMDRYTLLRATSTLFRAIAAPPGPPFA
jgi:hypothetical protein